MEVELDAKELANQVTVVVTVKHYSNWHIRLWIAKQLIILAASIAWVNIEWQGLENG